MKNLERVHITRVIKAVNKNREYEYIEITFISEDKYENGVNCEKHEISDHRIVLELRIFVNIATKKSKS